MKNIIDFFKVIVKYDRTLVPVLFCDILFGALQPFPKIVLSKIIFDYLVEDNSLQQFLYVISLLILSDVAIQYIFHLFDQWVEIKGQWLMFQLGYKMNRKTMDIEYEMLLDSKILEKRELGLKVVSGSNFIDMIRSIRSIVSNVIVVIGVALIVMQMGIYVLIPVVLCIAFNAWHNSKVKKVQYQCSVEAVPSQRRRDYLNSVCSDFSFVKEICINDCSELIDKKYSKLSKACYSFIKKMIVKQSRGFRMGDITGGVQDIIIYSVLGVKILIQRAISIGDFSMYFNAVTNFRTSVLKIMYDFADLRMNSLNVGHFIDYMNLEDKNKGEKRIDNKTEFVIEFSHVYFQYPGSENYVLEDICCQFRNDEKIMVVGANGAGKTTFIHLLLRLYRPTKGEILLNDVNINEYNYDDYLTMFSSVFQDYKTFAFSCLENITFGKKENTERIREVIQLIGLEEKMESLPEKMGTIVSKLYDENGTEFSGGEKQKMAIARALYKDSKVVIMDEPTAALDPLAEYELYKQLIFLMEGRLSFFISHRLASGKFCERILVFSDGTIKEDGSHAELMNLQGLYAEMYSRQAEFYERGS
ncbi:MAG: ABC transporter ATP-binding protein [Lachnospiraceae bacterium]|nr:ABC transporter ATP-binding protein [Lachnospiraceae bacterium]